MDIYTYVTENTFDSYLYQMVESKQRFIGQIMTSKSPVRSAEDIDATALSYAEIKALTTNNPHIREKMDLDVAVHRLRLLKSNHLSQRYALKDQIARKLPEKIASYQQCIEGYTADMDRLKENTHPIVGASSVSLASPQAAKLDHSAAPPLPTESFDSVGTPSGFSPMEVKGTVYTDKRDAGSAILAACKALKGYDPVPLGQYRGFDMELKFDYWENEYQVRLKGTLCHTASLGKDIFGNIQRIDNVLDDMEKQMLSYREKLENTEAQLATAKVEVKKPFPQEDELKRNLPV